MAPNVQVGGIHLLVDAALDTQAQIGGIHLIIDAELDAQAQVGGVYLLVDALPAVSAARVPRAPAYYFQ